MRRLFLHVLLILISLNSFSQSIISNVISNSGDNFVTKEGSLVWTLGEGAVDILKCDTIIHTQGFHQTYLNFHTSKNDLLRSYITIYPNPAGDFINISVKGLSRDYGIELYDLTGKILLQKSNIAEGNFRLDLTVLAEGNYFLKVNTDQKIAFKITKTIR